jgi:hypothetical protein
MYYPVDTQVTVTYRNLNDNFGEVRTTTVILNLTYADSMTQPWVDGPLQSKNFK